MADIELHVHPFLGNNSVSDVVEAMEDRGLNVLALEILDDTVYPFVQEQVGRVYPGAMQDAKGIRLPNGKYLLNAIEYNTREGIHILTIGYSMDEANPQTEIRKIIENGLENNALVLLDHPFVDNIGTRTAGHISDELEQELVGLCKEYSGSVALEWNGYCIPWMRQVLKHVLNVAGKGMKYHDVNKKAEELSEKLKRDGFNVPVVADTDLHGRSKRMLKHMGTSRVITDIEGETPTEVVDSLRKNIFSGDYENVKKYVSSAHLLEAFCIPILFPNQFHKPRS